MPQDYGPREQFGLFNNDYKKNSRQPDKTGTFKMSREFLKALVRMVKAGHEPELRLAAWVNENQPGKKDNIRVFLSIKGYADFASGEAQPAAPEPAPEPEDDGDDMPW